VTAFTLFHVAISLVGIFSGLVVLVGLLSAKRLDCWTNTFLVTTIATSVTGFLFPVQHFMPSHGVGILSIIVLTIACIARYVKKLAGFWRRTYVVSAVLALYFNVFVLIVQLFLKVPALHVLAPTGAEPPFAIAQEITLVAFIALGIAATIRFRPSLE